MPLADKVGKRPVYLNYRRFRSTTHRPQQTNYHQRGRGSFRTGFVHLNHRLMNRPVDEEPTSVNLVGMVQ